jgi:NADPH:quinone reductase-like Zn-dependent oxidoreductase
MRAIVALRYGGPEVLDLAQRPESDVGPRDVLIAVRAASLNPLDYKIRNGHVRVALPLRPPIGIGCDVAGVVAGVGARVSRFTAGDEVYARLEKMRLGGLAERVAADESVVALKPASASFAEAAAVPLAALTSLKLDAVFDTLGRTELESLSLVRRGGVVVGIGGLPDVAFAREWLPWWAPPAVWLASTRRRCAADRAGARFVYLFMRPDGAQLTEMSGWIDTGQLKPILHRTYPLVEFREAFAELERGRARGKIVVTI